jgi:hypothetical protein
MDAGDMPAHEMRGESQSRRTDCGIINSRRALPERKCVPMPGGRSKQNHRITTETQNAKKFFARVKRRFFGFANLSTIHLSLCLRSHKGIVAVMWGKVVYDETTGLVSSNDEASQYSSVAYAFMTLALIAIGIAARS